jgi:hypothetical protein
MHILWKVSRFSKNLRSRTQTTRTLTVAVMQPKEPWNRMYSLRDPSWKWHQHRELGTLALIVVESFYGFCGGALVWHLWVTPHKKWVVSMAPCPFLFCLPDADISCGQKNYWSQLFLCTSGTKTRQDPVYKSLSQNQNSNSGPYKPRDLINKSLVLFPDSYDPYDESGIRHACVP